MTKKLKFSEASNQQLLIFGLQLDFGLCKLVCKLTPFQSDSYFDRRPKMSRYPSYLGTYTAMDAHLNPPHESDGY